MRAPSLPAGAWLAALAAVALGAAAAGPAVAQSTSSTLFAASTDENATRFDCSFRARTDGGAPFDEMRYIARPPRQFFSVSVINGATFTANQADNMLATASRLLQGIQNPPGDVECCVSMTRTGNLGNFTIPGVVGGVINTCAQLNAVHAIGANIKVVAALNACTTCPPTGNTFAGCRSGNSLIVVAGTVAEAWAHEFGHMQGLPHTGGCADFTSGTCGTACATPCNFNNNDIMFCSTCTPVQLTDLSSAECTAYRGGATP